MIRSRLRPLAPLLCFSLATACAGSGTTAAPATSPGTLSGAPSRYASLDGARVHYKSLGAGREALVFVHGWTCDLESWRLQVPAFAPRVRVLALDLPGHGGSDKPRGRFSMDLFARAVESVMTDAGVDRGVIADKPDEFNAILSNFLVANGLLKS